ncbi:uncharacterized protein METZ01_LOCUS503679 [marine metagenome]|uniref:Uncharacterized protein n=1 Tax=marine metagenome TaxID=408172 RepID=A0A383E354_9ZZZZ
MHQIATDFDYYYNLLPTQTGVSADMYLIASFHCPQFNHDKAYYFCVILTCPH